MTLSEIQTPLAFAAFLVAAATTVLVSLACLKNWSSRRFWLLSFATAWALGGIETLRSMLVLLDTRSLLPSWEMLGLAGALIGFGTPLIALRQYRFSGAMASPSLRKCLLLSQMLMTLTAWSHLERLEAEPWDETPSRAALLNREVVPDVVLVTDQGRTRPVYRSFVQGSLEIEIESDDPARWSQVRQVANPDRRSNCHGWVFTGGEYLIGGEDVDQILIDNGYQQVDSPQANDVVIYRHFDGMPMHSGLVVAIDEQVGPVIESKWGLGGRYLHPPENPMYSGTIEYYRSSRANNAAASRTSHLVKLRQQDTTLQLVERLTGGSHGLLARLYFLQL